MQSDKLPRSAAQRCAGCRQIWQCNAWDDLTAIRTMSVIRKLGLEVGADISVGGFDDIPSAALVYPSLTTIRQPMADMGAAAMELLATQLKGIMPTTFHRKFLTELIIRESTRPPKKLV